jgi:membrane-bound ClpP family serine protease
MEIGIVILLLVVGVLLLLVEFFLIPGISVAGIGGVLFLGGSVVYAYTAIGPQAGHLTVFGAILVIVLAVWVFLKTKTLEKMALNTEIESKNDPLAGMVVSQGDEGIAVSRLAPMGKVKINNHVMEAKSVEGFIDEGTEIVVREVMSTNVVVERKDIV